jgi:quercetin dioxygenase-like cupin family protein
MQPYTYYLDLADELPEIPADSILSRTLYEDEQVKVTLFRFAADQALTEHTASHPAVLYFVDGEAELVLGRDAKEARAGTWVHMTPRLPHSVHARTPVTLLLLLLKESTK